MPATSSDEPCHARIAMPAAAHTPSRQRCIVRALTAAIPPHRCPLHAGCARHLAGARRGLWAQQPRRPLPGDDADDQPSTSAPSWACAALSAASDASLAAAQAVARLNKQQREAPRPSTAPPPPPARLLPTSKARPASSGVTDYARKITNRIKSARDFGQVLATATS